MSSWLVLVIGNSVEPSLDKDAFVFALLLPWYGPRELGYLILNMGIVVFLAGLGAVLYNGVRYQEKSSIASRFLWTALCSGLVYLCAVAPSEYLFIDGRSKDLFGVFVSHIEDQMSDKYAVMAAIVFGISVALLGFLVEHLFYTLPKMGSENNAIVAPEKAERAASDHKETPGLKRSAATVS
ncbi:MAG: hypothetical protein Q8Q46_02045 [Candidatus Giovannonibacteria bacterium]|nr:hypothetical protein [Candidatus Giovannonibacteria bacterium]